MPAWVVPAIMGAVSLISSIAGQSKQKKENRKIAETQNLQNEKFIQAQNSYNSPVSQMARFQDAGLNPNLIYGQGNPGNQSSPQQAADIKPVNYGDLGAAQALQLMNQTGLMQSQIQAQNANTRRTGVLTELNALQTDVLRKNPLLDAEGFSAIITSLKATAESKVANAGIDTATSEWFRGSKEFTLNGQSMHGPAGILKMETELNLLEQKFNLGTLDSKIKAEVVNSKQFQNAILEVQKKFMTDAEITPQHIVQFIQLLLMKILWDTQNVVVLVVVAVAVAKV